MLSRRIVSVLCTQLCHSSVTDLQINLAEAVGAANVPDACDGAGARRPYRSMTICTPSHDPSSEMLDTS